MKKENREIAMRRMVEFFRACIVILIRRMDVDAKTNKISIQTIFLSKHTLIVRISDHVGCVATKVTI